MHCNANKHVLKKRMKERTCKERLVFHINPLVSGLFFGKILVSGKLLLSLPGQVKAFCSGKNEKLRR